MGGYWRLLSGVTSVEFEVPGTLVSLIPSPATGFLAYSLDSITASSQLNPLISNNGLWVGRIESSLYTEVLEKQDLNQKPFRLLTWGRDNHTLLVGNADGIIKQFKLSDSGQLILSSLVVRNQAIRTSPAPGARPAPGAKNLKNLVVPYVHQVRDTNYNGFTNQYNACGQTSAVMALATYGKLPPRPAPQSYGWYVSGSYTSPQTGAYFSNGAWGATTDASGTTYGNLMTNYLIQNGLNAQFQWTPTFAQIKQYIDANKLVLLSTGNGVLTQYGHYVLVTGYTDDGSIIVNDPYGDKTKGGYMNYNGEGAIYNEVNTPGLYSWFAIFIDTALNDGGGDINSVNCTNIWGWAWDPLAPNFSIDVHIYDGPAGAGRTPLQIVPANRSRPDLITGVPTNDNGLHGFDIPTPIGLKDGLNHTLYFYRIAAGGAGPNPLFAISTVLNCPMPAGDVNSANCTNIWGWAWDPIAPNVSLSLHLYKDGPSGVGTFVQVVTANLYRSDILNATNDNGLHGFNIPTPASLKDGLNHTLYFHAIAAGGAGPNPVIGITPPTINCSPSNPIGLLEEPATNGICTNNISGWAQDPKAPSTSLTINIYRDGPYSTGTFIGAYAANALRTDVTPGAHGFSVPFPDSLRDGLDHSIYVYALNTDPTGLNPLLSGSPRIMHCPKFGEVNSTNDGALAKCTHLWGWAWDPLAPNVSIDLHLYKDGPAGVGTFVQAVTANLYRNDIISATNDNGLHGFDIPTPDILKDGLNHTLYFHALGSGAHPVINIPPTINCTKPVGFTVGQGSSYPQAFIDAYNRNGGAASLGTPTAAVTSYGSSGITWQPLSGGTKVSAGIFHFQNGGNPSSTRAFVISGSAYNYYVAGGTTTWLGGPTSDEFVNPSGQSQVSFVNGYLVWQNGIISPAYGWPTTFAYWKTQYFNNAVLSAGPTLVRNETSVGSNGLDFGYTWTANQAPLTNQGLTFADNWSIRKEQTTTLTPGAYRYTLCGDDGVRLYLNNVLVIDQWKVQTLTCYYSDQFYATTTSVPIKIDYYQGNGGAGLSFSVTRLSWLITSSTDTGSLLDRATVGKLSNAFNMAVSGQVITFDSTISKVTVSGVLPALNAGVILQGRCIAGKPAVTIEGFGMSGLVDSLVLSGRNLVNGIQVAKFSGKQIRNTGSGNKLSCVVATR
ncbi:MAG: C39 family peptidase [Chloroflexi bacterium]|nr:C39 family peptidase [Chloroflexota bacterium]